MRVTHQMLLDKIWRGASPYTGFPAKLFLPDLSGWNSHHDYLTSSIDLVRPDLVVEIGVWKGGSTVFMAKHLKASGYDGVVLSVDTFQGSWEHWLRDDHFDELQTMFGRPSLYLKFINNILHEDLAQQVLPLPLDSNNAFHLLKELQLSPAMVHIDAGHDYDACHADLVKWWSILRPGGVMIVDDYDADLRVWPSVARAVGDFRPTIEARFEAQPYKCRLFKSPMAE